MDSEDYGGCKSDNVNYHCYNLGDKDYGGCNIETDNL